MKITALLLSLMALSAAAHAYTLEPGETLGESRGYKNPIVLAARWDDGLLKSVRLLKHHETKGIGERALRYLPKLAVQHPEDFEHLDAISGASYTTRGFVRALKMSREASLKH